MAKKLYADGNTGVVAIYNPAIPGAFTDPLRNLHGVYFHSDLDYVAVAKVLDFTVTHPARSTGKKGTLHEYLEPNPATGAVGTLTHGLGYQPSALVFVGNDLLPANTQIQAVGSSFRTVAIELTTTTVRVYETAWVYQHNLPSIQKTYKVVLFSQPIVNATTKTFHIEPTLFTASRGKLDTRNNYLRRSVSSPMFWFSAGRTADAANGSFRIRTPNGSDITRTPYNGNFTGVPGLGVEV